MDDRRYTILVVDDNPDLLELLSEGLSVYFTIELAHDGIEGLKSISLSRPDCAIIDIKMPGLDGLQLVRALRGDPETLDIPLIILTALPDEQGMIPSLLSGADRYMTKPVLPSELIAAIHEALAISQQERDQRMRSLADEGDDA
jgi:DNA-binding response OmpR family regulator